MTTFQQHTTVPEDIAAAIREVKAELRRGIGDVADVFAEVEEEMRREAADIAATRERGEEVFPIVRFEDIADGTVPDATREAIHRRGCAVVRRTFPRDQAERWDADVAGYLDRNAFLENYRGPADSFFGTLSSSRPQIYPIYWSRPQIQARQHENMAATRRFMNGLWRHESGGVTWFDPARDVNYADRIRRRRPGDSSSGLSAHIDSGSIERWLHPAYRRVFRHLYSGDWRSYDPWDAAHRTEVEEYPSTQMCSVFRSFQGWTALSEMRPTDGVLHVVPIARAAAYLMLRPLLDDVAEDDLCGATLGRTLPVTDRWHPALAEAHTPIPAMEPGDTVWWHTDLVHSVADVNGMTRWGNVMYIAAAPGCPKNDAYAQRQAETFLRAGSPPDFAGEDYETHYEGRATTVDLTPLGRRQMGLESR
ncbi:DUF1479 domain-containing protein [Streptomyces iranensis]|uniref:DUF1479 domain-containing protein n=1 Tax=Streptomyces iranensis TaxID=576784 RepID=A0A061A8H3_9ACTN|nr:DUF1479 domain-containing protein [Streptomyces iranensis]MBP2060111.1 hypothetical protein [Streptomyces iranensis]CDR13940.1 predicted protein [Streptomyces iranensis]